MLLPRPGPCLSALCNGEGEGEGEEEDYGDEF